MSRREDIIIDAILWEEGEGGYRRPSPVYHKWFKTDTLTPDQRIAYLEHVTTHPQDLEYTLRSEPLEQEDTGSAVTEAAGQVIQLSNPLDRFALAASSKSDRVLEIELPAGFHLESGGFTPTTLELMITGPGAYRHRILMVTLAGEGIGELTAEGEWEAGFERASVSLWVGTMSMPLLVRARVEVR